MQVSGLHFDCRQDDAIHDTVLCSQQLLMKNAYNHTTSIPIRNETAIVLRIAHYPRLCTSMRFLTCRQHPTNNKARRSGDIVHVGVKQRRTDSSRVCELKMTILDVSVISGFPIAESLCWQILSR